MYADFNIGIKQYWFLGIGTFYLAGAIQIAHFFTGFYFAMKYASSAYILICLVWGISYGKSVNAKLQANNFRRFPKFARNKGPCGASKGWSLKPFLFNLKKLKYFFYQRVPEVIEGWIETWRTPSHLVK